MAATAGRTIVDGVVARSEREAGGEGAWVSLRVVRKDRVELKLVAEFKPREYGDQSFAQAAKYARRLAENLGVEYAKRRSKDFEHGQPAGRKVAQRPALVAASKRSDRWSGGDEYA